MIDLITYALLKRKLSEAATGISEAKIENGNLVFVLADGSQLDCGNIFGGDSPIINVAATADLLTFSYLDGTSQSLPLSQSDIKTAALTDKGLELYFNDGTTLVAPTNASAAITDIQIDSNSNLIFSFADGSFLNAGKLPTSSIIDDSTTSATTTYSSQFINNLMSYDLVLGGGADAPEAFFSDLITGGGADTPDTDILVDAGSRAW